jgi:hypothetical protein
MLWSTCAVAQQDVAFDEALKQVLRASKDRFLRIEGARVENRRREYFFEPRVYLPTATYCRIFQQEKTTIYGCDWERAASPNSFADLYERLVAKIESALGPEWNKQLGPRKSAKEVLFTADDRPTVQVIRETGAPLIHAFVLPAGTSQKGVVTLPDWHAFFHP